VCDPTLESFVKCELYACIYMHTLLRKHYTQIHIQRTCVRAYMRYMHHISLSAHECIRLYVKNITLQPTQNKQAATSYVCVCMLVCIYVCIYTCMRVVVPTDYTILHMNVWMQLCLNDEYVSMQVHQGTFKFPRIQKSYANKTNIYVYTYQYTRTEDSLLLDHVHAYIRTYITPVPVDYPHTT
jgi:hypothetical protein